jgi:hypothetical protein
MGTVEGLRNMIIALAVPAYQQRIHVQTACAWAQDQITAMSIGWRPLMLWTDINNIEVARNTIVAQAEKAEARLLLMCDADTIPIGDGLRSMWDVMQETGAAVVGAAVPVRNGDSMNCEPARPGEVYEGVVGTGYMLIDLFRLRALPKPWFTCTLAEDGLSKAVGSDIGFCRAVQSAGHKVVVNYRLAMAHSEQSAVATRP